MFALINKNKIAFGPSQWRKGLFENVLDNDFNIQTSLPNQIDRVIKINDDLKILPVTIIGAPNHNTKIYSLQGPYWSVGENEIAGTYNVIPKQISVVKNEMKSEVTSNRWKAEVGGASVVINGKTYTADTERESRNTYLQAAQLGAVDIKWKFPEGWEVLDYDSLIAVVTAVMSHVQGCFAWESQKHDEIDAATTLEELDNMSVEYVV